MIKPRVAQYVGNYLPVTENWLYDQLRFLKGIEASVICDNTSNPEAFPFEPILVQNIRRPSRGFTYAFWQNSSYARSYSRTLKAIDAQMIHAHFGREGVYILPAAKRLGLPLIVSFYGFDVSMLPRYQWWRNQFQRLFAYGTLFLAEGPHLAQKLADIGCPPQKIQVQRLGVDVGQIAFHERKLLPKERIRILMAASFREKKGIEIGLRALGKLNKWRNSTDVTIIGDGPLRERIERVIREEDMEENVRLLGYQPYETLIKEMKGHHIFLSPSLTAANGDSEGGAPVTLIVASASGMPIISTFHADIPSVVVDGKSGVLAKEGDEADLAKKIAEMLENASSWPSFGASGRSHVERMFDANRQGEELSEVYRQILS